MSTLNKFKPTSVNKRNRRERKAVYTFLDNNPEVKAQIDNQLKQMQEAKNRITAENAQQPTFALETEKGIIPY